MERKSKSLLISEALGVPIDAFANRPSPLAKAVDPTESRAEIAMIAAGLVGPQRRYSGASATSESSVPRINLRDERPRQEDALHALRERRAELAGELKTFESRLGHLRDSLVHLDATLRLFDPDANPSSISSKRPYERVELFGAGKLNRMILDALRKGGRPMGMAEVLEAVAAEAGFGPEAAKGLKNRVRANLVYLAKVRGLVVKDGEREGARWALRADCEPIAVSLQQAD